MSDYIHSPYTSPLPLRGYIVSSNAELCGQILCIWGTDLIEWNVSENIDNAMEALLLAPPNIVLLDMERLGAPALEVLRLLKGENVYRTISIVLCLKESDLENYQLDWRTVEADDLLFLPSSFAVIKAKLEIVLGRASRSLDTNPLTYLPGNNSIVNFVQGAINNKKDFALAYADLDNFKAFNDKYGFARGDEVLMLTGRLIASTVLKQKDPINFVGHVGGDDFVFCMPLDKIEDACKKIVATFDAVVPSFYDEEDRAAGMIISTDRQGNACTFSLMGISIAIVCNINGSIEHYGQAAEAAAQVKKLAKAQPGSIYVLDRRQEDAFKQATAQI